MNPTTSAFLAILVVGIGTFASRAVFIVGLANRTIPPRVIRTLEYVGPATLAALIVAMLIDDRGRLHAGWPELAGLAASALVGLRTRNLMVILPVAMAAYWAVRAVG